jgi:hypothetical protein
MKNISNIIKNKFCSACKVGPPSKEIGYKSSGTCLDYIYTNYTVPYSLAWEIYSNETDFPELNYAKSIFNQKNNDGNFLDVEYFETQEDKCLKLFNPVDENSYSFIINNWTMVFFINKGSF